MLRNLEIHNIALISNLSLEFDGGLTVLSGETGSGKSIIIDSLAFVLGERADKSMIKYGEDKAFVEVVFDVEQDSRTAKVMEQLGFEFDPTVVISRSMTLSGKNECRVNGRLCSATMLREISDTLVDIFGQSQHLNLLKPENHLAVLDGFCNFDGNEIKLVEKCAEYRSIKKQLAEFGGDAAERARQIDILQFQIDELAAANLSAEEENSLEEAHKRYSNVEKIASALSDAIGALSAEGLGAIAGLSNAESNLQSACGYDKNVSDLYSRILSARIEVEDICATAEQALSETEYDPSEIDRMETRREDIRRIKRKYGGTVEKALQFYADAQASLSRLENASEIVEKLNAKLDKVLSEAYDLSQKMSAERRSTAKKFEKQIKQQLNDLGMKGTEFCVDFCDMPERAQFSALSPLGFDKVEFLLSANVGEPLKSLAKVISGGEMSRFMLAVKNVTAHIENIPTMIYDEIDTGISGNIARMVAEKLASVSTDYQCIVITHLPQIAAMADSSIYIEKHEKVGRTETAAHVLTERSEKANEVARLMGGVGEHSVVSAEEMLSWADKIKSACRN